ncbi:serine/threonineeeee-protein phosphatase family [Sporothrix brasiliensis 5110]|uniref:Serine/threonineeeee-protein phosphatase family n=1 Tax=Sporothrix brasiliensis 5110 TaxID=1398154 RepID=A0A0C2FU91_9PEZI|nr:serine/threonineeeee-protein phosphatase family [Sporothrix brasiliensis 5110]KIH94573.1 serine/threonineeeee-protein phosphatase family [Sporothrix brasiliensis 5110]
MATAAVVAAVAAFAPLVQAMQPNAVPPLPAPMRPLQWGQINFLHTTRADKEGVDLLLVDTGDRVEGNGLYDASTPKGQYTYDIFRQQDIDIICSGNHELYQADTADREHHQTVPNFAGHYLASNLDYIDPKTGKQVPMSEQRYRTFQTKHQKLNIVAFGFLFNFTANAANSVVQPVQKTMQEPWFKHAITKEPADLFVVIGHVGARMAELRVIYDAIRAANAHTPIAIFAGHAHVRDAVRFDDRAVAIASGRYLETIGWMSVTGVKAEAPAPVTFARRYIDNNLLGLYYHSGTNATTFPTDHGLNVTATIAAARSDLDLETPYGCAPQNYWLQRRPHDDPASVFSLLRKHVLPEAIVRPDRADVPRLVLINTGAMRFDIFRGAFTRDTTFIVSPFISLVRYIPDVPYALARQVLPILNRFGPILSAMAAETRAAGVTNESEAWAGVTDWREMGVPEAYSLREEDNARVVGAGGGIKDSGHDAAQQKPLFGRWAETTAASGSRSDDDASRPPLVAGYTTWDDFGFDGDDAVHEPLPHFRLPNCIQAEASFPKAATGTEEVAEPATVDFVFFDFIQRFVLQALAYAKQSAGGVAPDGTPYKHYTDADVEAYLENKFTDYFADWVKRNWGDECT